MARASRERRWPQAPRRPRDACPVGFLEERGFDLPAEIGGIGLGERSHRHIAGAAAARSRSRGGDARRCLQTERIHGVLRVAQTVFGGCRLPRSMSAAMIQRNSLSLSVAKVRWANDQAGDPLLDRGALYSQSARRLNRWRSNDSNSGTTLRSRSSGRRNLENVRVREGCRDFLVAAGRIRPRDTGTIPWTRLRGRLPSASSCFPASWCVPTTAIDEGSRVRPCSGGAGLRGIGAP